jgi:hypothetical protein
MISTYGVPSKVELVIYQQCSGIELVSPVYVNNGTCYLSPNQRVYVGSTTQVGFNIDPTQKEPSGALMYELQKKNTDQSANNIISGEDEAKCVQLVIIWQVWHFKYVHINSLLITHDRGHVWDKDDLMQLAKRYGACHSHGPIENTWLIRDNTVLMTSLNAAHEEEYYGLRMTISEGSMKCDTLRPRYFYVDR